MKYTLTVKYDEETDDHFLEFPPEVMESLGWEVGDTIEWKDSGNGSYILSKKMDHKTSDQENNDAADGANKE